MLTLPDAAWDLLRIHNDWASKGALPHEMALAGSHHAIPWQKYPRKGCGTSLKKPHVEYFWHTHGDEEGIGGPEAGHFHIFLRETPSSDAIHLIGLSVGKNGLPQSLFCPNLWVTDDSVPPCSTDLLARLDYSEWPSRGRMAPVSFWLETLLFVFRQEMEGVLTRKDAIIHDLLQSGARDQLDSGEWILSSSPLRFFESIESLVGSPTGLHQD